jgi:hypothetical protein
MPPIGREPRHCGKILEFAAVLTATLTDDEAEPLSANEFGATAQVAKAGAPAQLKYTFWLRFGVGLAYGRKRPWSWIRPLAFACLLLVVTILAACAGGGGGNHGGTGTRAGTYALTVTGTFTSGTSTLTHNAALTLVVQ